MCSVRQSRPQHPAPRAWAASSALAWANLERPGVVVHPTTCDPANASRRCGGGRGRCRGTATSTRPRCRLWSSVSSAATQPTRARPFPRIPRISSAWRCRPSSSPGTTSAPSPIAGSTAYLTTLARRSRSNGWSSGTSAPAREPGLRSPGTRATEALVRMATSWSTPRGRTWWRGFATPRIWTAWRGGCPRSTPSSSNACAGWSATTAIFRTSSTRSRRDACSSSRHEAPSGMLSQRSDSPPMPSPRGCLSVRRRCEGSIRIRWGHFCTRRSIRRTALKS